MINSLLYIIIFINIIFPCPEGYIESSNSSPEDCIPEQFNYNSSTQQAAYFFNNVYFDGVLLDNDDWVGAFSEEGLRDLEFLRKVSLPDFFSGLELEAGQPCRNPMRQDKIVGN